MRTPLGSWLGATVLLLSGCGDDTSMGDTTPSTTTDGTTSTPDPTTLGTTTTTTVDPPADSGSSDGTSSGSTGTTVDPSDSSSESTGPVCGDDVSEGTEACDGTDVGGETCENLGFIGGDLACAADCSALDTDGCLSPVCNNGVAEGREPCDGDDLAGASCATQGFDSGTLGCENDCSAFDTGECGTCGNVIVDGDELCDGVALLGQSCMTQGFDYGDIACAADCLAFETSGCGICGDGSVGGDEDCDGVDLAGTTCELLGASGGTLACNMDCSFDLGDCDIIPVIYDVSAPNTNSTTSNYFRSNGYNADADGVLMDFEVYLGLAAVCDLDFYVYEAPVFGGPYTQVARTTVSSGPGLGYYSAGMPGLPITGGLYYILGVAWNCGATYYYDSSGAFAGVDAGVGIFNVSHWDNAYPGASDLYVPPNTGGATTAYVQRLTFAQ